MDERELSDDVYVGRPQERSEELGSEAESSEEGPTAEDVLKAWSSDDPAVYGFKGIPLRCMQCKVLILNRDTYLQHLQSKGHQRKLKNVTDPGGIIQLAIGSNEPQEEEETHGERLARIKSLAASASLDRKPVADDDSSEEDSSDDEVKEKKVGGSGGKRERERKKRPGKRQRKELKEKGLDPLTGKKYKAKPNYKV